MSTRLSLGTILSACPLPPDGRCSGRFVACADHRGTIGVFRWSARRPSSSRGAVSDSRGTLPLHLVAAIAPKRKHQKNRKRKARDRSWCVSSYLHPLSPGPSVVFTRGTRVCFASLTPKNAPVVPSGDGDQPMPQQSLSLRRPLQLPRSIPHPEVVYSVLQVSPEHLATACRDGSLRVFRVPVANPTAPTPSGSGRRHRGQSSGAVATLDHQMEVLEDEEAPSELARLVRGFGIHDIRRTLPPVPPSSEETAPAVPACVDLGDLLISANATVVLWNWRTGTRLWTFAPPAPCLHLCVVRPMEGAPVLSAGIVWCSLEGGGLIILGVTPIAFVVLAHYGPLIVPALSALTCGEGAAARFVIASISREPGASSDSTVARGGDDGASSTTTGGAPLDSILVYDAVQFHASDAIDVRLRVLSSSGGGAGPPSLSDDGAAGASAAPTIAIPPPEVLYRFSAHPHGSVFNASALVGAPLPDESEDGDDDAAHAAAAAASFVGVVGGTQTGAVLAWTVPLCSPFDLLPGSVPAGLTSPSRSRGSSAATAPPPATTPIEQFLSLCDGRIRWTDDRSQPNRVLEARVSMAVLSSAMTGNLRVEEGGEVVTLSSRGLRVDPATVEYLLAGCMWDGPELLQRLSGDSRLSTSLLLDYYVFFEELGLPLEASIFARLVARVAHPRSLLDLLEGAAALIPEQRRATSPFYCAVLLALKIRLAVFQEDEALLTRLQIPTFFRLRNATVSQMRQNCCVTSLSFSELHCRRLGTRRRAAMRPNLTLRSFDGLCAQSVHREILALRTRMFPRPGERELELPLDRIALPAVVSLVYKDELPADATIPLLLRLFRSGASLLREAHCRFILWRLLDVVRRCPSPEQLECVLLAHGHLIPEGNMELCRAIASAHAEGSRVRPSESERGPLSEVEVVRLVLKSRKAEELQSLKRRLDRQEAANGRLTAEVEAMRAELRAVGRRMELLEIVQAPPLPSRRNSESRRPSVSWGGETIVSERLPPPLLAAAAAASSAPRQLPSARDSIPRRSSLTPSIPLMASAESTQSSDRELGEDQLAPETRKRKRTEMEASGGAVLSDASVAGQPMMNASETDVSSEAEMPPKKKRKTDPALVGGAQADPTRSNDASVQE